MARREYSAETKAAVMAALLTGQSVGSVAEQYKIPEMTVRSWKSRQTNGESIASIVIEKRERIGNQILVYVEEALQTLQEQVKQFRDPKWLHQQPASEVAVLHGVLADKTIRILEALAADEGTENV